jgi:iron(III) transport system ATP-binding protein
VPAERRRVGVVPQEGALFPHLSVAENVGFGLGRGRDRGERIAAMLDLVGLSGAGHRSPHELSGGQQQRVALARALAPRPDVVLLDEPFAALDAGLRQDVRTQVRAALRAEHVTAVLVTHDQEEALSMADTVAVMRDGRIVQQGEPDEVYRHPRDPWVATFVGDAVIVPATVVGGEAVCALGRVPAIPHDRSGLDRIASGIGGDSVLLRPEQLRLVAAGLGTPATVEDVVYFGHDALATLRLEGTTVQTRVAGTAIPEIGATIGVLVDGPGVVYPAVTTAA